MGKLRVLWGRELCKLLEANGFVFVRHGKGDHDFYLRKASETTFTVSVPMHKEVAVGTLASIARQTGLPRSLFETE